MRFRAIGRVVARVVVRAAATRLAARGLAKGIQRGRGTKSFASRNASRNTARLALRSVVAARTASLVDELAGYAEEIQERREAILIAAFFDATDVMYQMTANAGQEAVFEKYVIPYFVEALEMVDPEDPEWPSVDIGEYMYFMGEIVETGNQIMEEACNDAAGQDSELDDIDDAIEETLADENINEDDFF